MQMLNGSRQFVLVVESLSTLSCGKKTASQEESRLLLKNDQCPLVSGCGSWQEEQGESFQL